MTSRPLRALVACVLLCLAACAHVPAPPSAPTSWNDQRATLLALSDFSFTGRIAVAAGTEGFSAGLAWQQHPQASTLQITGPLGAGGVQVRLEGGTLALQLSDGRELRGTEADAALGDTLGFDAPLASLPFWLRGCDDPASPASTQLDAMNRLEALRQQGWDIRYENYVREGRLWLPQRVTIRRDTVRVRLLIQRWTLPG